METQNSDNPSVLSQLRTLEVGQSLSFPVSRTAYVRRLCASFGLEWDKRFKTSTNRKEKTISVTRTA